MCQVVGIRQRGEYHRTMTLLGLEWAQMAGNSTIPKRTNELLYSMKKLGLPRLGLERLNV